MRRQTEVALGKRVRLLGDHVLVRVYRLERLLVAVKRI